MLKKLLLWSGFFGSVNCFFGSIASSTGSDFGSINSGTSS